MNSKKSKQLKKMYLLTPQEFKYIQTIRKLKKNLTKKNKYKKKGEKKQSSKFNSDLRNFKFMKQISSSSYTNNNGVKEMTFHQETEDPNKIEIISVKNGKLVKQIIKKSHKM